MSVVCGGTHIKIIYMGVGWELYKIFFRNFYIEFQII